MPKKKGARSAFAYDDAFRTMEGECDDILIPFVNHVFGQNYTKNAVIKRKRNEHLVPVAESNVLKRITDSYFEIRENNESHNYHMECESGRVDETILIRIFQYDTLIASDEKEMEGFNLTVNFPESGLLVLRSSQTPPRQGRITINTPEESISYTVSIIKVSDYSIDDLFRKRLYMLIPFHIFNYERSLSIIDKDSAKSDRLAEEYARIVERLNEELEIGSLSALSYSVIISMTKRVLNQFTDKHATVKRKVGDSMGGKVLDLPEIRAYHQGKDEGRSEGRAEGRAEGLAEGRTETIYTLYREGDITKERAMEKMGLDEAGFAKYEESIAH